MHEMQNTLEKLATQFKNQKFVFKKANRVTFIGVEVTYTIIGSQSEISGFIAELEKEWEFLLLNLSYSDKKCDVVIEYQVKPEEINRFLRQVRYRGQMICV